ncbi:putative integral membrane protein [Rosellinia necatrix]|uniref:Putative integral membrane protein n=1 Tax=Rosellinia necatrix TaxID=77044 RepID=A0A1S8A9I9_ROSNE|nr:putative integral membrane protein [Rosellinia necatrix]
MGTPHKGSELANWVSFFTNVIGIIPGVNVLRRELIKDLEFQSPILNEISKSFLPRCDDLAIMSFIETESEPPLTVLIVPRESATLGLRNERIFLVNTHHRNICRYPSAQDQTYTLVAASIKSILSNEGTALLSSTKASNSTSVVAGPISQLSKALALKHPIYEDDGDTEANVTLDSLPYESDRSTLCINGLKPKISATEMGWSESTLEVQLPSDTKIEDLQALLKEQAPDFAIPEAFKFRGRSTPISDKWFDCFTSPVKVTKGNPCYKESLGYRINANQSIASFLSKVFPDPLHAKIRRYPKWMQEKTGRSHSVTVGRDDLSSLQISFMRTVRVQEGQTSYDQLPPQGFGTFPLLNTQPYCDQLPSKAASQGGLFLPMYQSEAMYIAFDGQASEKFAVRPFIGGVNGISGKRLSSIEDSKSAAVKKQDYIVAPEQDRLDGVSVSPGVVNQFVAMKMNPESKEEVARRRPGPDRGFASGERSERTNKGGTVEWQMTGKDELGGIQLQIIPQFRLGRMFAGSVRDACPREYNGTLESYQPVPDDAVVYDVLRTPEQLGLSEGDFIHIREFEPVPDYDGSGITYRMVNRGEDRRKTVGDLMAESQSASGNLELEAIHHPCQWHVTVRGANTNKEPVLFKVDPDDDFSNVQKAARDLFEMSHGNLYAPGLVMNNPDIMFPINSLNDYLFATKPAMSYSEFLQSKGLDQPGPGNSAAPTAEKIELVLAPGNDKWKNVYHLNFLHGAGTHFGGIDRPLLLEIPHGGKITDICRLVEETTGLSTEGFTFVSPDVIDISNKSVIFGDTQGRPPAWLTTCQLESYVSPVPALATSDVVCLYVLATTRKSWELRVSLTDTVETVKSRIKEITNIPQDTQRLICHGRQLEDERTLMDYGIRWSAVLHLVLRLRGGGGPVIRVKLAGTTIFIGDVQNVKGLKMILFEKIGIFPHRQDLGLPDDFNLQGKDFTLELRILRERKLLGLGAGGSIQQEIRADTSDPSMWDVGSSRILYVHIVNSDDFEDITGIPPPDTPVTWRMYEDLRLPYDRLWKQQQGPSPLELNGKGISSDGMFDQLVRLEEENDEDDEDDEDDDDGEEDDGDEETQRDILWQGERFGGPVDLRKVPEYPVVLLETDQTVPWFEAVGKT